MRENFKKELELWENVLWTSKSIDHKEKGK